MRHFHFQIIGTSPLLTLDDMEATTAVVFTCLSDDIFVNAVSIACNQPESWDVLVSTEVLTQQEVEVKIMDAMENSIAGNPGGFFALCLQGNGPMDS